MTDDELTIARELIVSEELASGGIQSVSVDGLSVSTTDASKRLALLRELEQITAARTPGFLPIRMTKMISRGLQ